MKKFICIFMLLILAVLSVSCDATAKTNTTDTSKESTESTGSITNEDVTEAEEADSVIEYNLEFNSGRVVNITLPSRFTVGDVTSDYSDFGYLSEECNIFEDDQLVGYLNLTETTDMWDSEEIAQNFLEETPNPRAIYQGLMTGTMSTWDVNYKVIYQTDTEGTAVSLIACSFSSDEERDKDWIRTAQPFLDEGDDPRYYYDKAILGYHADRMERYTAIRFKYEAISDEEAENIAESLRIVLGEGWGFAPVAAPVPELPGGLAVNEPNYAGCGSAACIHEETLNDAYHTITGLMTTYLEHKYGETAFDDWKITAALASEQSEREDCKFSELTIYNLIQHFGILREDFERIYTNTSDYYGIEYNVDLLYSGDKKAIEAYLFS